MPKKRKSILAEVKRINKKEVQAKSPMSSLKSYKTWQSELSILEKLVEQYPGGMDKWEAELEDLVEVLHSSIASALELMMSELNLGRNEVSFLFSLFPKIKKPVDDFFEGQGYSKSERKILQTSYVISHLVGLAELLLQEGKSWQSVPFNFNSEGDNQPDTDAQTSLFFWWIGYCIFQDDLAVELPKVDSFAQKVHKLLFD